MSDAPAPFEDGSGATDLDLWGKWLVTEQNSPTAFAFGVGVTVPTGDDAAGLGTDAFIVSPFVSVKHRLDRVTIHGNAGLRAVGDGRIFGSELNGESAFFVGGGVTVPMSDRVSFVGEADRFARAGRAS